jgi:antirestriction protein ArdC
MKRQNQRADVYQRVTNQIIEAIEKGVGQWRTPWHQITATFTTINANSRKPYRGVNVLALWATAAERGYRSALWATYPQWQQIGAQVRNGEESAFVVFWKIDHYAASNHNNGNNNNGNNDKQRQRRRQRTPLNFRAWLSRL